MLPLVAEARALHEDRRPALLDAALYGGAALFAVGVALFGSIPVHREWGRLAIWPYAAGAVTAVFLRSRRARAWLALAMFVLAALVPVGLEAVWRSTGDPGSHAQSEAIITEEAARAVRHGRDPYAATYVNGPLHARPLGTKTHFPYLPGMLVFGMPRALDGRSPPADARVAFAVVTVAVVWLALRRGRIASDAGLRAFQVLAVLPTGALLMATGGDDLPVLGLMLLAVVMADRGRVTGGAVAAGVAAAMKFTAWPLVPFLAVAIRDAEGRPVWTRFLAWWAGIVAVVVLPFVAWNPGAFVEDAVKFPLGLGHQPTPAEGASVGTLLIRAFPEVRGAVVAVILMILVVLTLRWLILSPPRSVPEAVAATGLVLAVAVVLAPAGRAAYVVYPVNLLVWAWMLRRRSSVGSTR
jgi:Glycosyltransferase family 87